jgi:outer membrane protein assembly factor BamB
MRSIHSIRHHARHAAIIAALLLGTALLASCGRGGGTAFDEFGAYNALGGAHRNNDFSRHNAGPASSLTQLDFKSLGGGLLAPPLELTAGRLAAIARGEGATYLATLFRDSVLWRYRFPDDQHPMPGIAADSSGTLYVATSRGLLRAFSSEGKPLWEHPIASDSVARLVVPSPLLSLGDGVIAGTSTGTLACFGHDGKQRWSIHRDLSFADQFAADPALGLAISATHNSYETVDSLIVVDPITGAVRWSAAAGGRIVQGPVIAGKLIVVGIAVTGPDDRHVPSVAAFTLEGKPAWRMPLLLMPRGIASDRDGNLYISASGTGEQAVGGALVSIDPAGHRRWGVTLESGIPEPAAIGGEWVYFVSRRNGRTGLFTYGRDGLFHDFISIDTYPDVLALPMVTSFGELILAGLDQASLLRS